MEDRSTPALFAEIAFGTEFGAILQERSMACLAAFVGGVQAVVRAEPAVDERTADLLVGALVRELEPLALPMAWRIDRLYADHGPRTGSPGPEPIDAFALGRVWTGTRRTVADPVMRRALHHGLVNSFEPEHYDAGETLRLLELVRRLTSGDLDRLRGRSGETGEVGDPIPDGRLRDVGLLRGDGTPTGLGGRLVALIRAPGQGVPENWVPPWDRAVELAGPVGVVAGPSPKL